MSCLKVNYCNQKSFNNTTETIPTWRSLPLANEQCFFYIPAHKGTAIPNCEGDSHIQTLVPSLKEQRIRWSFIRTHWTIHESSPEQDGSCTTAHPEEEYYSDEAVLQQKLDKCVLQRLCLCPEVLKYEVTKHILEEKSSEEGDEDANSSYQRFHRGSYWCAQMPLQH